MRNRRSICLSLSLVHRYLFTPYRGREHVTFACGDSNIALRCLRLRGAARRYTRVLRKERAKHLAFQTGLNCDARVMRVPGKELILVNGVYLVYHPRRDKEYPVR